MAKPDEQLNYQDVTELAGQLLRTAGHCTINEQRAMGQGTGKISTNEALGMAVRALTEQAIILQAYADKEELKNAG